MDPRTSTQTSSAGHSSAARTFFGAITERVRGRSRSRSPAPPRSSQMSPPTSAARLQQPMQQPQQQPHQQASAPTAYRTASQSTAGSAKPDRGSVGSVDRTQWDQMVYGRHSSDWLFKSQRTLKRQSTGSSISSSRS